MTWVLANLEQILELSLDAPAVEQLERLYAGSQRWGDLVSLHERELGAEGTPAARKADLHFALGRIHEKELSEIDRAFDEYAGALGEDAEHARTIEALEAIMLEPAHAARAAEMLESVYLARLDWRKVMKAVEAGVSVELVRSARHHDNGNWGDLMIPIIVTREPAATQG